MPENVEVRLIRLADRLAHRHRISELLYEAAWTIKTQQREITQNAERWHHLEDRIAYLKAER